MKSAVAEPMSPLAAYRASNAKVKKFQDAQAREIARRMADFGDGLSPLLHSFVDKAEQARQIGIMLQELVETLPGKALTLDFYQQFTEQGIFIDAQGKPVAFEMLQWFLKVARNNPEPITTFGQAISYRQPLLLACGDEFALEPERQAPVRHVPADLLVKFKKVFYDGAALIDDMRKDAKYFPDGEHFDPELRGVLLAQLEPQKRRIDEFWELLQKGN